MKFIKDLGLKAYGNQGLTHKVGVYQCPKCLNKYERSISSVKSEKTKLCKTCAKIKHGMTRTDIYRCWQNMKNRCLSQKNKLYYRYGGRGIKICDRWIDSFENFYADMGDIPKGLEIDRIDNDGNYEPSNCRWLSRKNNMMNSSTTKLSEDDISIIKTLLLYSKMKLKDIGVLFNVLPPTISQIKTGKRWGDIPTIPV